MRFHSAPVIRLADAKPMQLGHMLKADGRWRLIAFAGAGDVGQAGGTIAQLCRFLSTGPIAHYTPVGADVDSVIDLRAIFQTAHREMEIETLSELLLPRKGRYGLIDYEKVFCPDLISGPDIFDLRGIDRTVGALLIVRPDQYVSRVLPLDDFAAVTHFFDGFMRSVRVA